MTYTPDTDDEDCWISLEAATRNVVIMLTLNREANDGMVAVGSGLRDRDAARDLPGDSDRPSDDVPAEALTITTTT